MNYTFLQLASLATKRKQNDY